MTNWPENKLLNEMSNLENTRHLDLSQIRNWAGIQSCLNQKNTVPKIP